MGQVKKTRIIIVIFCLLLTGIVIYRVDGSPPKSREETASLAETFTDMKQWHNSGDIPLSSDVVDALKLDDYLFRTFSNGREKITLYIGFYNTKKKVGAAHDPMVCYPGQGWVLTDARRNVLPIKLAGKEAKIAYSTMIAERDGKRNLLVYWFQAYDQATSGTLSQKIALLRSKIMGGGEDNAFVRIGIDLQGKTEEEALRIVYSFADDFYPVFVNYIHKSKIEGK